MSNKTGGGDIARSIKEYHEECELRLNAEIERLRELIWDMADGARYENDDETAVLTEDFNKLKKEAGDE